MPGGGYREEDQIARGAYLDSINGRDPKDDSNNHTWSYKWGYNGFKLTGTFDLTPGGTMTSTLTKKEEDINKLLMPLLDLKNK